MTLSFRPHHFLCTLGFQGKGYSPHFIENYEKIVKALQENEELSIEVVPARDSICGACPHQGETECDREEKIQGLDQRHSQILGIKPGDRLSWRRGKDLLKQHMTVEAFHQACAGCSWKPWGICEKALKDLHNRDQETNS